MQQLISIKVPAGYACLLISLLLYIAIFSLPFVELSTTNKVATGSILYGASYIFMFAGFGLLGREIVDKLKGKWKSFRSRDSSIESGKINNG
ncbi:MAG: transporter suffix domain-containing protein [Candidatus Marinimicrobia bacterium]|jgi:hypothetical protein|nr:transporter suffix domain-containing protein [Candidatus Neomarinimicrobiota bacterium]|tara:strand:+ start:222 stop:497 length:276 start_codon:yes stop_codon:yes gene_type:complete